tara:strand:+ start:410 stop:559 length:150 start_codon:yes stop_codon:yes gene_type:complete
MTRSGEEKSKINNKPTGKVKYKKIIGRRSKLLKLKSPIAYFFARQTCNF